MNYLIEDGVIVAGDAGSKNPNKRISVGKLLIRLAILEYSNLPSLIYYW